MSPTCDVRSRLVASAILGVAALMMAGCAEGSEGGEETASVEQALGEVTCVTITRPSGTVADTYLHQGLPAGNFGTSTQLSIGPSSQTLLRFDLGAVPANAALASATLQVRTWQGSGGVVRLHRVTSAWSEATVTYQSFGNGFSPTVEATYNAAVGFNNVNVLSTVQAWVNGANNQGFYLESSSFSAIFSSEAAGSRPQLRVCYYPDNDGDGFDTRTDCDDNNPNIRPGRYGACGGHDGSALVSGGVVADSPNYTGVFSLGASPGVEGSASSPNYKLRGGLIGATQGD